jgi:hypothetical protein
MDNLKDILANRKSEEPYEIKIIKDFLDNKFQSPASVSVTQNGIIIGVKGAALAGALRPYLHELKKLCGTEKRLIIRIQ